jgi:hypothetical protein
MNGTGGPAARAAHDRDAVPAREPSFWDYVKAAFFARRRLRLLGDVPVNVLGLLGLGVAGLVNPGFWLVGAGLELGYLTWLSQNARFRNLVKGDRLRATALDFAGRLKATVARLTPPSQARWRDLEGKCGLIRQLGSFSQPTLGDMEQMREGGLNSLLLIYAKLLLTREAVLAFMREEGGRELEERLKDTESRVAATTSPAVKRSLEANLELLRKRIEHHRNARENLQVLDAELERIENQVELIRAEAAVSRDPEMLSARIDAVASTMGEASQFLRANAALLGDLGDEETLAPPPVTPAERTGLAP